METRSQLRKRKVIEEIKSQTITKQLCITLKKLTVEELKKNGVQIKSSENRNIRKRNRNNEPKIADIDGSESLENGNDTKRKRIVDRKTAHTEVLQSSENRNLHTRSCKDGQILNMEKLSQLEKKTSPTITKQLCITLKKLTIEELKKNGVQIKSSEDRNIRKRNRNNEPKIADIDGSESLENGNDRKRKRIVDRKTAHTEVLQSSENRNLPTRSTRGGGKKSTKIQLQDKIESEAPAKEYLVDEIILATISGYAPWPARILDINGQTITVQFFGTGEINLVRPSALRHFNLNAIRPLLNRKGYKKAIMELELVLQIPSNASLFESTS